MAQKNVALDPAGHLGLSVSNFELSKAFYSKLFSQIGFTQIVSKEKSAAWKTSEGFGIWIRQAEFFERKYVRGAPGIQHLCLKAKNKEDVDRLYGFLVKEKMKVYSPPSLMTEYLPHYYAVYFPDPDGIKLEFAFY